MPSSEAQRTLVKSPPELWTELSDPAALARHLGEFGEIRTTRVEPETTVEWEADAVRGTVQLKPSGWGTKVTLTVTRERPAAEDAEIETNAAETSAIAQPTPEDELAVEHEPTVEHELAVEHKLAVEYEPIAEHEPIVEGEPVREDQPTVASEEPPEPALARTSRFTGLRARLLAWLFPRKAPVVAASGGTAEIAPITEATFAAEDVIAAGDVTAAEDVIAAGAAIAVEAEAAATEPASGSEPEPEPEPEGMIEPDAAAAANSADEPASTAESRAPATPLPDLATELARIERSIAEQDEALLRAVLDRLGAAHHRPFSRG